MKSYEIHQEGIKKTLKDIITEIEEKGDLCFISSSKKSVRITCTVQSLMISIYTYHLRYMFNWMYYNFKANTNIPFVIIFLGWWLLAIRRNRRANVFNRRFVMGKSKVHMSLERLEGKKKTFFYLLSKKPSEAQYTHIFCPTIVIDWRTSGRV